MKPGTLVALRRGLAGPTRKVALVLGPSRAPGKVRIALWQHAPRRFTSPRAESLANIIGPAPADWPQTRAARQAMP